MKVLSQARDLKRRRGRERASAFVAEGVRAVEELLRSPIRITGVLISDRLGDTERGRALAGELRQRGVELTEVSDRDFASASDTEAPQGVLAIGAVPQRTLADIPAPPGFRAVVLDAVQDPGNVGTILRTAAALGAHAAIALPGTVDLWNPKVVRAAMGALFHRPALAATWGELDAYRSAHDVVLWGADARGTPIEAGIDAPARLALAVGNEGAGLSEDARRRAARIVSLPLAAGAESLNVAVAAGILLFELRPR